MVESTKVDRNALAKVFKDPKTLRAVEAALNSVQDGSSALALATQAIAETAALRAPTYLVASADPTLNNERVLGGASGVSIDYSTPGLATINVNVSGALGYTPTSVVGLTGVQSVAAFKIGLALDLVENKSSATIRSEITSGNVTGALGFTPLAPGNNLSELTNYATARSNLGLIIGTNVQAYNANLTTYAGIAPSANVQSVLSAADYAAIRALLSLGTAALQNTGTSGANVPLLNGANTWSAAQTPSGGLVGVTGASNAAAGHYGEYASSTVLFGSAVALTNGIAANVTSISLTAGDWDVSGNVVFGPAGATTIQNIVAWISTTSATLPTYPNSGAITDLALPFTTGNSQAIPAGVRRISLAATTTVYLSCRASFGVSTMVAYGFIGARRVR